jgi:putative aldouronate transport system substrate-binding protein
MKMGKWTGAGLTATLAVAVALSGCSKQVGGSVGTQTGSGSSEQKGTEAKADDVSATGLPIVKNKVTITMAAHYGLAGQKPFGELPFFKEVEDKTNVHIDWQMSDNNSWGEKKNLIFASGDLPEAFYGHYILDNNDVVKYGAQGMLIPLEGLIDKYAPNLKKMFAEHPEYKKDITAPDGHIYSLPTVDDSYPNAREIWFIDKKWLDQLHLPMPTTTDEFYKTLKAFKDNDMNGNGKKDEIPFTFRVHVNTGIYSSFGAFGLLDRDDHLVLKGDKVVYAPSQPEYKEAIKYFHQLFADGLIDQEALTHDDKVYSSKITNSSKENNIGVFSGWSLNTFFGPDKGKDFVPLLPLKGPKGDQIWNRYPVGVLSKGAFAITSANKHPEATMRWADYMYDPLVSIQAVNGMLGTVLKQKDDGTIYTLPVPQGMNSNEFRHSVSPASASLFARQHTLKTEPTPASLEKNALDELYKPYLVKDIFPKMLYSSEDTEKLSKYMTDIDAYMKKMFASWIVKGGVDDEWDGYVKKLNEMGLQQVMDIHQKTYEKYKSFK